MFKALNKALDKTWKRVGEGKNKFCIDCKYSDKKDKDQMECSHINFRIKQSFVKKLKDSDRYPLCAMVRRSRYCLSFEPSFMKKLKEYILDWYDY